MLLWCSSWLVKLGGDVSDTLVSAMLTKTELCLGAVLAGWQLLGRDPGEDRQLVEREPAIPADRQLLGRGCSPGRLAAAWEEHV